MQKGHDKSLLRDIILFTLIVVLVSCIYIGVFKISIFAICILFIFFSIYLLCTCMALKSADELKKYEKKLIHIGLVKQDYLKILYYSLATLSPTYLCLFLVSLFPIYRYEVWLIFVFPCIVVSWIPASSILDEYNILTRKKIPFVLCFVACIVTFCVLGVVIGRIFFIKH